MHSQHLDPTNKTHEELGQAIYVGDYNTVATILDKGINIDLPISSPAHDEKLPPLFIAALCGHTAITKLLIENAASVCDAAGVVPNLLFWICKCKNNKNREALLAYLLESMNQIIFQDGTSRDHILAAQGNLVYFDKNDPAKRNKLLLPNHSGYTPIFFAMLVENEKVIDIVLDRLPLEIMEMIWIRPSTNDHDERYLLRHLAYAVREYSNVGYALFAHDNPDIEQTCARIFNLAIEKAQDVLSETREDKYILDILYRHLAKLFLQKMDYFMKVNMEEQMLTNGCSAIKAYEKINIRMDKDITSLNRAYYLIAGTYKLKGDKCILTKKWKEAAQLYQQAYDALEREAFLSPSDHKILHDTFCRSLSLALSQQGHEQLRENNLQAAIDCYQRAQIAFRRIQTRMEGDDAQNKSLSNHFTGALCKLAQVKRNEGDLPAAIELLQRALAERGNLKVDPSDKAAIDIIDTYRRYLTTVFSDYATTLYENWDYVQFNTTSTNAINNIKEIIDKQPNDYKNLSQVYLMLGGTVGEFGSKLFKYNSDVTKYMFAKTWIEVYKASFNKNDESMGQMLQLLEMVLQNCDTPNFPKSHFQEYLQDPINKAKLAKKIQEAKEIINKQKTLQTLDGSSSSFEIALTQKVLKVELDNKTLQEENQALVKRNSEIEDALKLLQKQVNLLSANNASLPRLLAPDSPFNKHLIAEIPSVVQDKNKPAP